MPKISTRRPIEHALELSKLSMLHDLDSNSNSDIKDDILLLQELLHKRYLAPCNHTVHNPQYERQKLHLLPQLSFQQLFRTTLPSFMKLVEMIEAHTVFQNNSANPQRDPAIQLAIALCCFGSNGNGAAIHRLKNFFTVGYGTINLYTKRVITALLHFRKTLLVWPNSEEQLEISQVMHQEGFPGCIGFIDGTKIPLSQKPERDGNHYFDWCKTQKEVCTLFAEFGEGCVGI